MTKAYFLKTANGLVPENEESFEALKKVKIGNVIHVEWKQPRNYEYHKKFFALLQIGFDAFEPPIAEYRGNPVQKSFERFRKDVIIAAGYFDAVANIRGEVRAEAKSISFGSMSQEDFEALYNNVVNVLLQRVLSNYTRSDLDNVVNQIIRF